MLGSVNIQLSPKASPRFVFGFLLAHGLLFLGVEYIIFPSFPLFTLAHALIGIGIYLFFYVPGGTNRVNPDSICRSGSVLYLFLCEVGEICIVQSVRR